MDDNTQPMPDEDNDLIASIANKVMEIKEDCVTTGPEDIYPVIFFHTRGVPSKGILAIIDPTGADDVVENLPVILATIAANEGPPRLVCFVSDAYCIKARDGENLSDVKLEHGTPSEMYRRGDPRASECLMIAGARIGGSDDGEYNGRVGHVLVYLPYHYGDGGVIWDEPMTPDSIEPLTTYSGRVPDALTSVFRIEGN